MHPFPKEKHVRFSPIQRNPPLCQTLGSDVSHRKCSCEKVKGGFRHIQARSSGGAALAGRKPAALLLEL